MKLTILLSLGFALATFAAGSIAAEDTECLNDSYVESQSLAQLPEAVRTSLKTDSHGLAELSDRGGGFNAGDVGPGPHRRFSLAALGTRRIFAAVEHGGRGYNVELWSFTLGSDGWHGIEISFAAKPPNSLQELVAKLCRNAA